MHDVIRDMALWLACERGQKKNKYLVKESVRPAGANKFVKWKEAERISLWGQDIRNLDVVMLCPKVVTLLVTGTFMGTFPSEVFESMHALAVLDFSGNAQRLQTLQVIDCSSIREVLSDGSGEEIRHENRNALSCLTTIHLQGLPRLKSIRMQALALPLLKEIEVLNCPKSREASI
ncbi:hypothetical protein L484_019450 [Morus notabilis]|uniref:Disease resistance protein At4g27190-like leucine-rich repeats domain-containing protein n=1 Tax=Morus notabilis TaxID=981085 RepID=W9S4V1_9ROSA|nr:hypothetical protein L484_019450 [Morus notabilis]